MSGEPQLKIDLPPPGSREKRLFLTSAAVSATMDRVKERQDIKLTVALPGCELPSRCPARPVFPAALFGDSSWSITSGLNLPGLRPGDGAVPPRL